MHDKVRKMFYKDHPFEASRGTSLVEMEDVVTENLKPGPKGIDWTELRQRSRNPSPEEYETLIFLTMHADYWIET